MHKMHDTNGTQRQCTSNTKIVTELHVELKPVLFKQSLELEDVLRKRKARWKYSTLQG